MHISNTAPLLFLILSLATQAFCDLDDGHPPGHPPLNRGRRRTTTTPSPGRFSPGTQYLIGVQGAGSQQGQDFPGLDTAPAFIRASGLINNLRAAGHDVLDYGDLDFGLNLPTPRNRSSNAVSNAAEVSNATLLISRQTTQILRSGRFPLTFGGDHSIALGTIQGASRVYPDLAVLWIDAHSDINTPATTPNGNMHGMPLGLMMTALAADVKNLTTTHFSWVRPNLSPDNMAYIGLRYINARELGLRQRVGISDWNMRDIDKLGVVEVVQRALRRIGADRGRRPVYVSIDLDLMDDLEVGASGGSSTTTVLGGLTLREGMTMLDELRRSANVIGLDITEVNPTLATEPEQRRISVVVRQMLGCVFGVGPCREGLHPKN